MKLLAEFQRHLGWRLFLSYLVIIVVGVAVLFSTAWFLAPASIGRHAARMQAAIGNDPALTADLYRSFTEGVTEVLGVAAVAATVAVVLISGFTARRIIDPIRDMTSASQNIAAGDYHQRVPVPGTDELGVLAQSFNRMAMVLEQTERRRMELIGNVAHELRTPLASIRSSMEGLVDGVLPAEPETYLAIQGEAARLQRLVRDLEELSRAEARQISLNLQPTNLIDLLRAAVERLRPQFEDKNVELDVQSPSSPVNVQVDSERIIQVLINLLGNALQYTPGGGKVTLSARREGSQAVISVADTGIGIATEYLPHIFERFYRVDRSRSRAGGGSGIGLTIARHLVEAHGGRIWATSDGVNQGSTFTFTLPLA
jgi:signal transduction histidine kinase